ncbi:MAG: replicative DNA helicase [Planctomycetes bacterium]|nr:replicative DNA helicase [Planctomycetota bacterium]
MSLGGEGEEPGDPETESAAHKESGGGNPYNLEAEQAVLGGLLIDPEQFDLIEGRIAAEDFFAPTLRMVFAAMLSLRKQLKPIDPVLLRNELQSQGLLDAVGGSLGLARLTDYATSGANVEHYADIVREQADKRLFIKTLTKSFSTASSPYSRVVDLMGEFESDLRQIVTRSFHDRVYPIAEVLNKVWDNIETPLHGRQSDNLLTGFTHLDEMLSGLHKDELIVVAGRPSMGKSTFALNIFRNVAAKAQQPAVFFTLEMSAENILKHLLAAHARVDGQKIRKGNFSDEEFERLSRASGELRDAKMWIDEKPAISLPELRGKARHLKLKHEIQLIVIDYLQLMTASDFVTKNRTREQEVSEISRGLKALAKELHLPIIALSQLSRRPELRSSEGKPILSDLRESGAIEQDADVVLMLHRHDYYKPDEKTGEAEVIIAKQRNGPTGSVDLAFIKNQLRFENLAINANYTDAT